MRWLLAVATWIAMPPPGAVTALAERDAALLVGTGVGLFAAGPAGWERTPVSGSVLDAASAGDELWIATTRGLWWWGARGEPESMPLGAGARVRGVAVDSSGAVWAASESGLFVRRAGGADFERDATLPPGDVAALRAVDGELFAARSGALWVRRRDRFETLVSALGPGWWELRSAAPWRGSVYLAVPRGLWRVGAQAVERVDLGELGNVRDLHADGSGLWVATSRGLWRFDELPGATSGEAVLDAATAKLLAVGARLLAATDRGIAELERGPAARAASAADGARAFPDVGAVQAAALAYQDLDPARLRRVEERAQWRGWLPLLRAGAAAGNDRARDHDRDEVFSAGEVRSLYDSHYARDHGFEADVEIVWQLGDLAAPDDALAVSRERRLVVELRDQVLERVNRLYFERLRVRDALAQASDPARRRELELRMAELTAQLDAWTGGRFSRLLRDSPDSDRRQP